MILLEIAERWEAYGDHKMPWIEELFLQKDKLRDIAFFTSTHMVLGLLRALIAEGKIDCDDVVFIYKNECIPINKYGHIDKWPKDLCETNIQFSMRVLDGAIATRKREREEKENANNC